MKKWAFRLTFALLMNLGLGSEALGQTKFRLFDQVIAKGSGITPGKGDLYYSTNTSGLIGQLPIGTAGDCLTVSGAGIPQWSSSSCGSGGTITFAAPSQFNVAGSGTSSITLTWNNVSQNYHFMGPVSGAGVPTFRALVGGDLGITTKGDLITYDTALTKLGVGTDGYVLTADSAQAKGIKWAAGGSGTVTSVAMTTPTGFSVSGSPVTTSGTLGLTLDSQSGNKFLASSGTGGASTPAFRALVGLDLGLSVKGQLLTYSTVMAQLGVGTDGYVLMADSAEATGLKWASVAGTGTVTSVALALPGEFSISGSPVTGAGTLTGSWANQTGNMAFMSPDNATGTPGFRAVRPRDIGILAKGDLATTSVYPYTSFSILGIGTDGKVLMADSTQATGMKWETLTGTGTVTSVAQTVPAGFSISGSPVTTSGTLAITFGSTTANRILMTNGSGTVSWSNLATSPSTYVGLMGPSGVGHAAGLAPDPGAVGGTTKFLREDATYAVPPGIGTVTSVDASVPAFMTISGNPITSSGTLSFGFGNENANMIFAGPATGAAAAPTWRALVPEDYPVFIASGATHAAGAVPQPPLAAGTTKFLREDATWVTPTFSSSIEVKEVDGTPDVTGVSVVRFNQADGLSVTDNTGGTVTVSCSTCAGPGTTATKQDEFTGNSSADTFTLSATPATNGVIYVALNGLPQLTTSWTLSGSNVVMGTAPITGATISVAYYTQLAATVTHTQEDFTGAGSANFTLAHTPASNGVLMVSLGGLVQPQASWSLTGGGGTLTMATTPPTGAKVTISYNY